MLTKCMWCGNEPIFSKRSLICKGCYWYYRDNKYLPSFDVVEKRKKKKKYIFPKEAYKLKSGKRCSQYLSDGYVKDKLVQQCSINRDYISDKMVELKRQQLKLFRARKEVRDEIRSRNPGNP